MPITIDAELRKLSQDEFGRIAYDVMRHAFDIHRELGRFFDEGIYQGELAHRCGNARIELPIEVTLGSFKKVYFVDLLVAGGAVFEIKTADDLHDRHRAQLLNYLLLADFAHGKLINFLPEAVQHEFVNTTLLRADRTAFEVDDRQWQPCDRNTPDLRQYLIAMLRDLGTGLDLELYHEALIHCLGGPALALRSIDVIVAGRQIGRQEMLATGSGAAVKLTVLKQDRLPAFEDHYRRLLNHANIEALHWVNLSRSLVIFRTLRRQANGNDRKIT